VREVVKEYEDGKMDITTEGMAVFRILESVQSIPDKLYSGAIVSYPENKVQGNALLMQKIVKGIYELHRLLKVNKVFVKPDHLLDTYDVAHHAGLSLEEEYELLCLVDELQRQEYLKRHLNKVLPVVAEMESLKEKIKLNGHFKDLKGLEP
jgi:Lon protease-like protein